MYRIVKFAMPVGSLAVMLRSLNWIDMFHLTAVLTVAFIVAMLAVVIRRWKRREVEPDESDAVFDGTPPPSLLRGLLIGAVCSLLLCSLVLGSVRVLEATPFYSSCFDGNLPKLTFRLQTLADAGSYEEAARLTKDRLKGPISRQAREQLARKLVDYLTYAGKVRRDGGTLDSAYQLLQEAVATATAYGLSPDLATALAHEVEEVIRFRDRLEALRQSGKWAELLTAVEERMAAGGPPSPWLSSLNVQSSIRLGVDPNRPWDERLIRLQHAVDVAVKYGIDASEARRELSRLQEQKHDAAQIEGLCKANDFDQAVKLLRLAIARSPREQWPIPLDRRLYEILLAQARSLVDLVAQENKYEEAQSVAKEYGLDGSTAEEALRGLETRKSLAASSSQLANAKRIAREQQQQAEASRKEAETRRNEAEVSRQETAEARRKLAAVLAQTDPCELTAGAKASLAGMDTRSHPVLLVDLWVARADDSPYLGLVGKDFRATFGGLPAAVALARIPARRHERGLRIVMVMDASGSMEGKALEEAKRGAVQFIGNLPPEAQVAVVQFASSVQVACEFSQDRLQIRQAIERITASGNTALYKAINYAALRLVNPSVSPTRPEEARFIVLLSDGRDTAGGTPMDEVLTNCRRAEAQVCAIGLRSADLDATLLKRLTAETKGVYLEAGNVEQLATQFRIASVEVQRDRYRLAVSVPGETYRGTLAITIGSGPNRLMVGGDIDASQTP